MKRTLFLLFTLLCISFNCIAQQFVRTKSGMVRFYLIKGTYSLEEIYNPNLTLGESKLGLVKSNQQLEVVQLDTLHYKLYKVLYKGKLAYIHRNSIADNRLLNEIDPGIREQYRNQVLNHTVCIGMTAYEVECSLGIPNDKHRTVTSKSVSEQWVYNNQYIYLDDGFVTSYQD